MFENELQYARLLAEVLRLQRWAGGEFVPPHRIFGLMHGFESVIDQEEEAKGVSSETQESVEKLLEDVEAGKQSTDGPSVKDRLRREHIDESQAALVMRLCLLQSRFIEGVKAIASGLGSVFHSVVCHRQPESDWFGALHYVELVDSTEGAAKKMHAVFSPCVPRVGEIVEPQSGQLMEVVNVVYVTVMQGEHAGIPQPILVPHVTLRSLEETE